jgi:pilus assembly protein CpaF
MDNFERVAAPQQAEPTATLPLTGPDANPVEWARVRRSITDRLLSSLSAPAELRRDAETTQKVRERYAAILQAGVSLTIDAEKVMERQVLDEVLGFGPLEALLANPAISEIMVNGPQHVFVEQKGHLTEIPVKFDDDTHLMRVIDRIIRPLGRRVDRKSPMVDARLPDGSRVNVIIPPASIHGATLTIRKFSEKRLQIEDLIQFGTLTPQMAEFLRACIVTRLNTVVAGGTGSGKTTLLNVLSNFIPDEERIVTIEDSAELQLNKPHVVSLEARPAEADGTGRVTIRELVVNSLRMRPDRIVVGEVRSGEALDMLQAMNTGHDGSLTTIHANTPRDVISRLETLVLMAGIDFPIKVVREQISGAIDLIVQQARLRDGSRKIVKISEVQGMEGDVVVLQDIFQYVEKGLDTSGKVLGEMQAVGIRPKFTPRLETAGFKLPPEIFAVGAGRRW